jgi:hypothetical protein
VLRQENRRREWKQRKGRKGRKRRRVVGIED